MDGRRQQVGSGSVPNIHKSSAKLHYTIKPTILHAHGTEAKGQPGKPAYDTQLITCAFKTTRCTTHIHSDCCVHGSARVLLTFARLPPLLFVVVMVGTYALCCVQRWQREAFFLGEHDPWRKRGPEQQSRQSEVESAGHAFLRGGYSNFTITVPPPGDSI